MVSKVDQDTIDRIEFFRERFEQMGYDEGHYLFACHAAFPIAFTPDLLYQIWVNFKAFTNNNGKGMQMDYLAVSDVLLSGLCRETGKEIYEMDTPARAYLLDQLETDPRFGKERLRQLAIFLYQYIEKIGKARFPQAFIDALRWTALATLSPPLAAQELSQALSDQITAGRHEEIIRMRNLLESYANQEKGFENLLHYSKGLKAAIFGMDASVIQEQFNLADAKILSIDSSESTGEGILRIPIPKEIKDHVQVESSGGPEPPPGAQQRIAAAKASQSTLLDLSELGLDQIPEEVFELTQLKRLDLFKNRIAQIPDRIAELTELEELLISINPITTLPKALAKLTKLRVVKLDEGELSEFPEVLFQLTNLQSISLEKNEIDFLPEDIVGLQQLRLLDLRGNLVANVPRSHLKSTGQKIRDYFSSFGGTGIDKSAVLLLASDPDGVIQEEEEISAIQRALQSRQDLEIITRPAISTVELYRLCRQLRFNIKILHLAAYTLQLRKEEGDPESPIISLNPALLQKLIGQPNNCELVLLNVCDSLEHAQLLFENGIKNVIGVEGKINDRDAISNSVSFYDAWTRTEKVEEAFEKIKTHIDLKQDNVQNYVQSNVESNLQSSDTGSSFKWRLFSKTGPEIKVKNLFALLVGINQYHSSSGVPELRSPVNDVQAFRQYLQTTYSKVTDLRVETLINEKATYKSVVNSFQSFLVLAGEADAVLFYFSGHGSTEAVPIELQPIVSDTTTSTLVLYDSRTSGGRELSSLELSILINEINQKCKNVTVLLDCSYSGGFFV